MKWRILFQEGGCYKHSAPCGKSFFTKVCAEAKLGIHDEIFHFEIFKNFMEILKYFKTPLKYFMNFFNFQNKVT